MKYHAKLEKNYRITLPKELTEEIQKRGLVFMEGQELEIRLHAPPPANRWNISIRPSSYEVADEL